MRFSKINRRHFLFLSVLATPALACADANWLEPQWVKIRSIKLAGKNPAHRIVHFTDIHHKGDRAYLESVVEKINGLSPDAVCFTGDLIEEARFIPETLEILQKIKSPLYGVPGNHDYWSHAKFAEIEKAFAATGGAWLMDSQVTTADGKVHITGVTCLRGKPALLAPKAKGKNIMLLHYPLMAERVAHPYDLLWPGIRTAGRCEFRFMAR